MASTLVHIKLSSIDVLQTLDGLESRAVAYERTAAYLRTGEIDPEDPFIIEECSYPEEADEIAKHFRDIIDTINAQWHAQKEEAKRGEQNDD